MSSLVHLIYSSAALQHFPREELVELLDRARTRNRARGITGVLLYVDGSFLQVLEGEPDQVDQLFDIISADDRHGGVVTIIHEPIAKRDFEDWSMGLVDITAEELGSMDGLNDFFAYGSCMSQLGPGRTKKLLKAFQRGRWRSHIVGHDRPAAPSLQSNDVV